MALNVTYEHLAYSPNAPYIFSKIHLKSEDEIGKTYRIEKTVAAQMVS
jgi:hypothetical protein